MAGYGKEADRLLERLGEVNWKKPGADPVRVEQSLRTLYVALGLPFPGFRWVPDLSTAAGEFLRPGLARWRETGAVRNSPGLFLRLNEAIHQATPTGAYRNAWHTNVTRLRMKCGSEPKQFRSKIWRLRDGAMRASLKLLRSEAWRQRSATELQAAAELVFQEAGSLFQTVEKEEAVKTLKHGLAVDLTRDIPRAAEYFAEWRYREADLDEPLKTALKLIDAVDAGLGYFWPGPAVVVAVPRPPLS